MKGFIEVTSARRSRFIVSLTSISTFIELDGVMYISFMSEKNDTTELKESYEEIKELIKQAL